MTYTEKELDQFLHGISLSLLSKKSAQHWRYDEETAKEIEWLEALERKVRADKADRKTEPQTETKTETQNSNLTFEKRTMRDCYNCKRYETEGECIECHYEPKTEPSNSEIPNNSTISEMEQVDKDINVRSKDEPQAEYRIGYYTPTNAEILKAIEDEPQTERSE